MNFGYFIITNIRERQGKIVEYRIRNIINDEEYRIREKLLNTGIISRWLGKILKENDLKPNDLNHLKELLKTENLFFNAIVLSENPSSVKDLKFIPLEKSAYLRQVH